MDYSSALVITCTPFPYNKNAQYNTCYIYFKYAYNQVVISLHSCKAFFWDYL